MSKDTMIIGNALANGIFTSTAHFYYKKMNT